MTTNRPTRTISVEAEITPVVIEGEECLRRPPECPSVEMVGEPEEREQAGRVEVGGELGDAIAPEAEQLERKRLVPSGRVDTILTERRRAVGLGGEQP
jgi:hypothetical protein